MKIKYTRNDDITKYLKDGNIICHCVSADYKLGAGVALAISNARPDLRAYLDTLPHAHACCDTVFEAKDVTIHNLVTKNRYFQKPTYNNLGIALANLRFRIHTDKDIVIHCPRIGSGLDKLNWFEVVKSLELFFPEDNYFFNVITLDGGVLGEKSTY